MEREIIEQIKKDCTGSFYLFDIDRLYERVRLIYETLGNRAGICYAMKANPFLLDSLKNFTDYFEVCSPGEYEICFKRNINPGKIIVSGVNKTKETMERILELGKGKGIFTVESLQHYNILKELARTHGIHIKLILRLSSGNQFGMDYDSLFEVLEDLTKTEELEFYGIHYYSGTQKKLTKINTELEMLECLGTSIHDKYGITPRLLEYGPGLSVSYYVGDKSVSPDEQLNNLKEGLDKITSFEGINIELGRFIASECGMFITNVIDIKKNFEINYCILDGGIHQLNYYGQLLGMKIPFVEAVTRNEGPTVKYNLCGSLCTVSDILVKEKELPMLEPGDYLIFRNCGAYSVTEAMAMFLSRDMPGVYTYSEAEGICCLRKTTDTYKLNTNEEE